MNVRNLKEQFLLEGIVCSFVFGLVFESLLSTRRVLQVIKFLQHREIVVFDFDVKR